MKINKYCLFLALIVFFNLQCFYLVDSSVVPTSDIAVVLEFLFFVYVYIKGGMKGISRYRYLMLFPLVLMLTSSFAAHANYGQPLLYGIRAQRAWIMAMLTYFPISGLLRNRKLRVQQLIQMLEKVICVYIVLILFQYALGNTFLFMHVQNSIRYGSIRLYTSTYFILLLYFIHLWKILDGQTIKLVNVFVIASTLSICLFVQKSRMGIVALLLTTTFAVLVTRFSGRKLAAFTVGLAAIGVFIISPYGQILLDSIFGSSASDAGTVIRETGRAFYIEETLSSWKFALFGSGYANMDWGATVIGTRYSEGLYYNDNGIIGLFFYYGFLFIAWMAAVYFRFLSDAWKGKTVGCFLYLLCGLIGIYTLFPYCYVTNISFGLVAALIEYNTIYCKTVSDPL